MFSKSATKYVVAHYLVLLATGIFLPIVAKADSLPPYVDYYLGPISSKGNKHTYKAWGINYVYRNDSPFGWSWTYANEGYFPNHYRDGVSLEAMAHAQPFNPNWSFAIAAGPYAYFDTIFQKGTTNYSNQHGLGMKIDLTTTYDYSPVVLMLGISQVLTIDSYNTTALIFGLGFELDPANPTCPSEEKNNEITFASGKSLVNAGSGQTQHAVPFVIDYRYHFAHPIDWTVSALHEGATSLTNRQGLASEIWARANFFSDRLSLSMGLGPYVAKEKIPANDQRTVLNGLLSASANYVFYKPWGLLARITWHRVLTGYNRDSDIFLLGLGVNF